MCAGAAPHLCVQLAPDAHGVRRHRRDARCAGYHHLSHGLWGVGNQKGVLAAPISQVPSLQRGDLDLSGLYTEDRGRTGGLQRVSRADSGRGCVWGPTADCSHPVCGRWLFSPHSLLRPSAAAVLAYRTWPFSKAMNKCIHLFWHVAALVCFCIALKAVWRYKNLKDLASLLSLHRYNCSTSLHTSAWVQDGSIAHDATCNRQSERCWCTLACTVVRRQSAQRLVHGTLGCGGWPFSALRLRPLCIFSLKNGPRATISSHSDRVLSLRAPLGCHCNHQTTIERNETQLTPTAGSGSW